MQRVMVRDGAALLGREGPVRHGQQQKFRAALPSPWARRRRTPAFSVGSRRLPPRPSLRAAVRWQSADRGQWSHRTVRLPAGSSSSSVTTARARQRGPRRSSSPTWPRSGPRQRREDRARAAGGARLRRAPASRDAQGARAPVLRSALNHARGTPVSAASPARPRSRSTPPPAPGGRTGSATTPRCSSSASTAAASTSGRARRGSRCRPTPTAGPRSWR